MDASVWTRWAWPRGPVALQDVDWRAELYHAVATRLGRPPTTQDLSYDTAYNEEDHAFSTTLEVSLDGRTQTFVSAPQDTQQRAIRCASWIALVVLRCAREL